MDNVRNKGLLVSVRLTFYSEAKRGMVSDPTNAHYHIPMNTLAQRNVLELAQHHGTVEFTRDTPQVEKPATD